VLITQHCLFGGNMNAGQITQVIGVVVDVAFDEGE
jgi:hypothetical protein